MKQNIYLPLFYLLLIFGLFSCKKDKLNTINEAPALQTKMDSISYLFGYSAGQNWKMQSLEAIKPEYFWGGVKEAYNGEEAKINLQEGGMMVRKYLDDMRQELSEANEEKSQAFLEKNATKEGVITTDSGLQYKVVEEGKGPKPKVTDRVEVRYKGENIDGEVFDQTKGDDTAQFYANRVIKGWTEVLTLMPTGSKYKVFIPADLAYGPMGSGKIGPNEALIFDIELVGIVPENSPEAQPNE